MVWELDSGALLCTLKGHTAGVHAVAITVDGKHAVSASSDNTVRVWELESGGLVRTLKGHAGGVRAVAITPDGRRAVCACGTRFRDRGSPDKAHEAENTIKVWELESGALVRTLKGHTASVNAVAITPDDKTLVSGSSDSMIKVWELSTAVPLSDWATDAPIACCVVSHGGRRLVAAGGSGRLHFLDIVDPSDCLSSAEA